MTWRESVYERAPWPLQHALTSLRGLQLRRLRYTAHTWRTLERLTESQYWSLDRLREHQLTRLREIVRHACELSPYYQRRYRDAGVDASTIRSLDDIGKLPIVPRNDLRKYTAEFVRRDIPCEQMWVANTSGTSGSPLSVYFTHADMQERIAFMERLYQWYTPGLWRRRASFTGKLIVDPENVSGPVHRTNLAINQQLYSSHHLRPQLMDRYVRELSAFAPQQIDGIASPIFAVADYVLRAGHTGRIRPSVVIPTSETIWPHIRDRLSRAFDCPVANQYGSQEGAPIAYECPAGGFHQCLESGVFEVLRPDDTTCGPGEAGRLVVTSFFSSGTPLIRYEIGDIASTRDGVCVCGRALPLLEQIDGRIDDMFFTVERGLVTKLDSAFKGLPNSIVAAQVAQIALDAFELRVIPDREMFEPPHAEVVVEHLREYLGRASRIEIHVVDDLPRSRGGKVRAMVNECTDPVVVKAITNDWSAVAGR